MKTLKNIIRTLLPRPSRNASKCRTNSDGLGYGWRLTPEAAPIPDSPYAKVTSLPHSIRDENVLTVPRTAYDDQCPTAILPKIPKGGFATLRIATADSEDDACAEAKRAVLSGDWDTALAGLMEYVTLHPVAA